MAVFANVGITGNEATPVVRTFEPVRADGGYRLWETMETHVIGRNRLSVLVQRPKEQNGAPQGKFRIKVVLDTPTLTTISNEGNSLGLIATPSISYRTVGKAELTFDHRSTDAERTLAAHSLGVTLSSTMVKDVAKDLAAPRTA